ncbi:hypothetical protein GIB67_037442 [Kingdonia uniflora]|uniref:Uncharacterized protein n=1 Tax=Kingdonia uniflora TaxID=39325 RepID=A0A7J7NI70_9MAGN|nr:hypothetical protein GIB67_037442 [Kingdonia uniflora]
MGSFLSYSIASYDIFCGPGEDVEFLLPRPSLPRVIFASMIIYYLSIFFLSRVIISTSSDFLFFD